MSEIIIEYNNASKYYKTGLMKTSPALVDLNLSILKGENIGLIGHNGAGKTTSLKILLGFVNPTSGYSKIFNKTVMNNPEIKDRISYIPENVKFHPHLTPGELIRFYGSLRNITVTEKKIRELMDRVNLPSNAINKKLSNFSKGMNQRLAISLLFLKESSVIILDEPTTGLDPAGRILLKEIIHEKKEAGATIIISSHQLLDIEQMVDKIAVLRHGKLLEFTNFSWLRRNNNNYEIIFSDDVSKHFTTLSVEIIKKTDKTIINTDSLEMANDILKLGIQKNLTVESFTRVPYTLEDYYMDMVGKKV